MSDMRSADKAMMLALLDEHATVNTTAAREGSPNPLDWRNIRRVCRCGEVIPDNGTLLGGRPFDSDHRAHVADVLTRIRSRKADE